MLRKFAIVGLVLLVIGGAVLGWVLRERKRERQRTASWKLKYSSEPDEYLMRYNRWLRLPAKDRAALPLEVNGYGQAKTNEEIEQEQQERLNADLDKLAAGEINAHPFADVLYGENWQGEVEKYKKRKEISEFVLTGSVVCTSIGGTTFGWCFLLWVVRLFIGGASALKRSAGDVEESGGTSDDGAETGTGEADIEPQEPHEQRARVSFVHAARSSLGRLRKHLPVVRHSQRLDSEVDSAGEGEHEDAQTARRPMDRKKIPVLISGRKPTKYDKTPEAPGKNHKVSDMQHSGAGHKLSRGALAQRREQTAMLEESLKAKTKELERRMAQSLRQTAAEHSKPLNGALEELTQQVSAIREYASHQQQRVEKLQDGYDWNIIRTFCLRVIRCIDNLESRIERLSERDVETVHLEEVKDELIFALESSGVEQFRPDLNSPYRGQEKCTEAVKEREQSDSRDQAGKIAKVVRPGYRYFIDEDKLKVVRAAQVKLFG